ncbi:MAG: ATP-binding cassette domain-containing protein, partial [Pseudomonadota bacterium]
MLKIENLFAGVDGVEILKGLSLTVPAGEVHAIMGPNGSGKSTLSHTIAGRDDYAIREGAISLDGASLVDLDPDERAAKGVFLSFQHPMEIPGVATMNFIRTALNAQRAARGEDEVTAAAFLKLIREKSKLVGLSDEKLK